jgi:hypothetical protein
VLLPYLLYLLLFFFFLSLSLYSLGPHLSFFSPSQLSPPFSFSFPPVFPF